MTWTSIGLYGVRFFSTVSCLLSALDTPSFRRGLWCSRRCAALSSPCLSFCSPMSFRVVIWQGIHIGAQIVGSGKLYTSLFEHVFVHVTSRFVVPTLLKVLTFGALLHLETFGKRSFFPFFRLFLVRRVPRINRYNFPRLTAVCLLEYCRATAAYLTCACDATHARLVVGNCS